MKTLISGLILAWNGLLAQLSRAVGLFLGGIVIGFMKGIQDQREMKKYLDYKAHMIIKEHEKENKDDSTDGK